MNKIVFMLILALNLFAYSNIEVYTFGMKLNYKEYSNSKVIDRDYSGFNDIFGIGIKYETGFERFYFNSNIEYAAGDSIYDGSTWNGVSIKVKQTGLYFFNAKAALGYREISFHIGYREWQRGSGNYSGDYKEIYYWPYVGVVLRKKVGNSKIYFFPQVAYNHGINPKLKVELGNNPILDLGDTYGGYIEMPLYFKIERFKFDIFYRFEYWHIHKSKPALLVTSNGVSSIYEPESITKNQYIGVGVEFSF